MHQDQLLFWLFQLFFLLIFYFSLSLFFLSLLLKSWAEIFLSLPYIGWLALPLLPEIFFCFICTPTFDLGLCRCTFRSYPQLGKFYFIAWRTRRPKETKLCRASKLPQYLKWLRKGWCSTQKATSKASFKVLFFFYDSLVNQLYELIGRTFPTNQ